MGYSLNSFPLVISVREEGSLATTTAFVEKSLISTANRARAAFDDAGKSIDRAFSIDGSRMAPGVAATRREVEKLTQSVIAFQNKQITGNIRNSLSAVSGSAVQREFEQQARAENALEAQRQRAQAERIASIEREFAIAMQAIQARQAAQTASFKVAEGEGNRLIALDRQRIQEGARSIAAPSQGSTIYFDPAGSQQAAAAARLQAAALAEVARAADLVALETGKASAADRAFAASAREAAAAAEFEAVRLEAVALTHGKVAAAASAAGLKMAQAGALATGAMRIRAPRASWRCSRSRTSSFRCRAVSLPL